MADLILPPLLVLTDRRQAAPRALVDVIRRAVDGGAQAVVLREKDLPAANRADLAATLQSLVDVLLVASAPVLGDGAGGGVHLAAADPFPVPRPSVVGRSCHDIDSVLAAAAQGCDYVTVSPVFATASKPGYGPPLGVSGLRELVDAADGRTRVYALGGVSTHNAAACIDAGAAGVAVMGEVMRAADPAATVVALLDAVTGVRGRR